MKLVTFPLTKKQIEGSVNMQALQPKVKELQAMYANDPERLQMETARLYKEANFNPLAGCLPTFATLPVFIGLYRALSNASVEGLLQDGFYWIPSLGGPATIEMRNDGAGFSWLFPLVDGRRPLVGTTPCRTWSCRYCWSFRNRCRKRSCNRNQQSQQIQRNNNRKRF